jgi:hypothetical protein
LGFTIPNKLSIAPCIGPLCCSLFCFFVSTFALFFVLFFLRCSFALMVLSICHVVSIVGYHIVGVEGSSHCFWGCRFVVLLLLLSICHVAFNVTSSSHCFFYYWFVALLIHYIVYDDVGLSCC